MVSKVEVSESNVILTERLSKVYRSFWGLPRVRALNEVSFAVPSGSVFGLLGPNGSGKTTIIKLLLGLARPTGGRAVVLGKPAGDQKARARIGYLPEESYLYEFLSGRQTLDFYGKLFGMNRQLRRERTEELLNTMGIDRRDRNRRVGSYSKGMARRIGLAQALINDPDLIILDEPTTGLDPIGTVQMKKLIKELQQQGKTIFLSSHLLADVED
ncbi:MAG: ABC transporter ATP-binding protein, partial [Phycisphaerae bacterium]|nr:ABC transporter ATP-binding protein [Phycisphaerae bacterium]